MTSRVMKLYGNMWYWWGRPLKEVRARDLRRYLPEVLEELGQLRDYVAALEAMLRTAPVQCGIHREHDSPAAHAKRELYPLVLVEDADNSKQTGDAHVIEELPVNPALGGPIPEVPALPVGLGEEKPQDPASGEGPCCDLAAPEVPALRESA